MGVLKCKIWDKYILLYKESLNIDKIPFNIVRQIALERYKQYTILKDITYNQFKLLAKIKKI